MSSDPAEIQKSVRSYMKVFVMLMIFTVITVAASRFHLAVPVAITVALIIAAMKGSMVAAVFMHLSHEKRWVYGTLLLTAVFFLVLLLLPLLTSLDSLGDRQPLDRREDRRIVMSLRAFHCCSSRCRSCWRHFSPRGPLGNIAIGHDVAYLGACAASLGTAAGLAVYAVAFQRKTRNM